MKMFYALYRKELSGAKNTFLTLLGLIFGFDVFLTFRIKSLGYNLVFGLSFLPLAFLCFWGIFRPLALTRGEWKEGTAPFLRSLPVDGWRILGAKLLAAFTEWVGLNLATFLLSGLFYAAAPLFGAERLPLMKVTSWTETLKLMIMIGLTYVIGILLGAVTCQLSFLLGRLVNRFTGVVSLASTILLVYLTSKGSELLAEILTFLPFISIEDPSPNLDIRLIQSASFSVSLVLLIEFTLLFFVSGWVMEKKVEF